jgi:hypothetical protein
MNVQDRTVEGTEQSCRDDPRSVHDDDRRVQFGEERDGPVVVHGRDLKIGGSGTRIDRGRLSDGFAALLARAAEHRQHQGDEEYLARGVHPPYAPCPSTRHANA